MSEKSSQSKRMERSPKVSAYGDWPNEAGFEFFDEQREPIDLKISGRFPDYIRGILYRVGPGGNTITTSSGKAFTMNHWFDGFTKIHRFEIKPDRITYRSRNACDGLIREIQRTGHLEGFSFAQRRDPCKSFFQKLVTIFWMSPLQKLQMSGHPPADVVNCGVTLSTNLPGFPSPLGEVPTAAKAASHEGVMSLHSKTDANLLQSFDPETLEPVGIARQTTLHPLLKGQFSASHARTDPETGDLFNYNLEVGCGKPTYRAFRVSNSTGETKILATIKDAAPSYLHSFFLSAKFMILCIWPARYAAGGIKVPYERNIIDAIAPWDPKRKTKFYVIDKLKGGVIAVYESDAFFAFHTINAWDDGNDIVMDVPAYDNLDVLKKFYIERLKATSAEAKAWVGKGRPRLHRWRLPGVLGGDATSSEDPSSPPPEKNKKKTKKKKGKNQPRQAILEWAEDAMVELPTLNPEYITKPSRYVYGITDRGKSTLADGLIKYDTELRKYKIWEHHTHTPGEAIFVADPNGTEEDDGVLLSVILDGKNEKSYLLALNPKDMTEVARAELDQVVNLNFHGTFHGSPNASGHAVST